ncbi:MAG: nucleoside deaminase [Alphaproteobacteria bacterium]
MPFVDATPEHRTFMAMALEEARLGFDEGGVPVGSVMVAGGAILARGHNRRVQEGDPIAHGEMDCLRRAGRRPHYKDVTLYTTLSPCMMCTGAILQFGIPRVIIGEQENFPGNPAFLAERGVDVVLLNDSDCIALMRRFIEEKPQLWNEDIAEDD